MRYLFIVSALLISFQACTQGSMSKQQAKTESTEQSFPLQKSDEEWKAELTPEQYNVLRKKGTEARFTEIYNDPKDGIYRCSACNTPLFDAKTKYNSGSGLASLLRHRLTRECGSSRRQIFRNGAKRSALWKVRWSPRTRIRRRPQTYWLALLHQFRLPRL